MSILVCNIGWMNRYRGLSGQPDRIVNGGKYVVENGRGGEMCNFHHADDGNVYGYVETLGRSIKIESLGARPDAEAAQGVDVVWVATHPRRGRYVVGWYKNATVFREQRKFAKFPSLQHRRDELTNFRIRAKAFDATVLDPDNRTIELGRGKGWIGHANWWFPEERDNPDVLAFLRELRAAYRSSKSTRMPTPNDKRGKWGRKGDPERKAEVERAAIAAVKNFFEKPGQKVESVEKDNLGWDLEVQASGRTVLRLEVKGLFGVDATVGVTPREFRALNSHIRGEGSYRLCVVTEALDRPRLHVLRYDYDRREWIDEVFDRRSKVVVTEVTAAIVSVKR